MWQPGPLSEQKLGLLCADRVKAVRFGHELIRRGVCGTPGGKLYLSLFHTDAEIDRTLELAAEVQDDTVRDT